jgi:hypothetical protein
MKVEDFGNSGFLGLQFRKSPNMVFRRIMDECVLVPISPSADHVDNIYSLNEVGAHIWEMVEPGTPMSMIVDSLVNDYEVDPDTAAADLKELIRELREIQAIEVI